MTEAVMAMKSKLLIILVIVAQLWLFADARADEIEAAINASGQETATGPGLHDMSLVSFQPWVVEGQVLGAVAEYVYDDVTTQRPTVIGSFSITKASSWRLAGLTDSASKEPLWIVEL